MKPATITINGTDYTAEIATVESTYLGREDHGIFTGLVSFSWGCSKQSNSPRGFDDYNQETKTRAGNAFGMDHIIRICTVFQTNWENITGKRAYILKINGHGMIEGIANIDDPESNNLIFAEHAKSMYPDT